MASEWFYQVMGKQVGPVSSAELRNLAERGTISTETPIANVPTGPWVPATRVKGLFAAVGRKEPSAIRERVAITGPTSYTANNLIAGERILYAAEISPMIFMTSAILFVLFLVGILMGMCHSDQLSPIGILLALFCFVTCPLFAAKALVTFLTTECVLTDRRVVGKSGFISRHSLELLLAKVEGFAVSQGICGRIFDYGTVIVTGTGGSHTPFRGIARPSELRKRVQQQISVVQG